MATTLLNFFLLNVNFDKSTIRLHILLIFFILAKFQENSISIAMMMLENQQ